MISSFCGPVLTCQEDHGNFSYGTIVILNSDDNHQIMVNNLFCMYPVFSGKKFAEVSSFVCTVYVNHENSKSTHRTISLLNWLKLIDRDKKFCKILARDSLCDEMTIIMKKKLISKTLGITYMST